MGDVHHLKPRLRLAASEPMGKPLHIFLNNGVEIMVLPSTRGNEPEAAKVAEVVAKLCHKKWGTV